MGNAMVQRVSRLMKKVQLRRYALRFLVRRTINVRLSSAGGLASGGRGVYRLSVPCI